MSFRRIPAVLGLLGVLSALFGPGPARADFRLLEELPEGADEGADPVRFFDVTGFLQPGYVWRQNDPEGNNPFPEDDHFWLQRARFGFRAQLFPWVRARFEAETTPSFALADAFIDFALHPYFNVRVGQFQLPFLRTFQYNEVNLAFMDRLAYVPTQPDRTALRYLSARDIGMMFTGLAGAGAEAPTFEYAFGMFLGRGPNQTRDVDSAFLFSLRLQLHVFGPPDHVDWESDLARSETPKVAVAGAVYTNCDDRAQFNLGTTFDAEARWEGLYASASFVRFNNGPVANDGLLDPAVQNMGRLSAYENFFSGLGNALGYGGENGCGGMPSDAMAPEMGFTVPFHVAWGTHFQLQYVLPHMLFPVDGMDLELLFRFDYAAYNNPDDASFLGGSETAMGYTPPDSYANVDNPPTQWRLTFGLNWFPTGEQQFKFSLNYQHRREAEDVVQVDRRIIGIENDILWLQLTLAI